MQKEQPFVFEKAMEELERTVAALESGTLDLDKSFELYEKGIQLVKRCEKYLEEKQKLIEAKDES